MISMAALFVPEQVGAGYSIDQISSHLYVGTNMYHNLFSLPYKIKQNNLNTAVQALK